MQHHDKEREPGYKLLGYPAVWSMHRSGSPTLNETGSDLQEKQKRVSVRWLTLGCGAVAQCVRVCGNPALCWMCITTIIPATVIVKNQTGGGGSSSPRFWSIPFCPCCSPLLDLEY